MSVNGYLDKVQPYTGQVQALFNGAMQSEFGKKIAENWTQDKVNSNTWALVKGIGIAVTGKYYFGTAFTRHLANGLWEGAKATKNMWENYKALKVEEGFDSNKFLRNEFSNFNAAIAEFKQAGKDLGAFYLFSLNQMPYATPIPLGIATGSIASTIIDWSPFGLFTPSPFGIPVGMIGTALAVGYVAYAPQAVSGSLNRLEAWWRPENVKPITDREVESLSVWGTIKHLTDGSYSLSRLFNMHKTVEQAPNPSEKVEERRSRNLGRETVSEAPVGTVGEVRQRLSLLVEDDTSTSGEEEPALNSIQYLRAKWGKLLDHNGEPQGMSASQLLEFRHDLDLALLKARLEPLSPKKKSE